MSSEPIAGRPVPLTQDFFPGWPHYDADERAVVDAVLRSGKVNYWTGQEGREFEREYAAALGVGHAIALANGTLALELALRGLGIGAGDEVIVTPRSFMASTSAAVLQGATPVFADVEPDSQNISAASIERVITPRTRAILPVHLAGWPCEMGPIMELAGAHRLRVVEDCAQANGATYRDKAVGSFGHAAAFSFCQDKIITTGGEGGLLATDDEELWQACWSFKDHGKSWALSTNRTPGTQFRWLHERFGSNYRLTEIQSAIGRLQLKKLPQWQHRREQNALLLAGRLRELDALRVPLPAAHIRHAWYRLYAFVVPQRLRANWSRERILAEINTRGVPAFVGSCPEIYRERAFDRTPWRPQAPLPVAQQLGETSMCFLLHPTLEQQHMTVMADTILDVVSLATRRA
jgi:dTDP-4-amino-4,6-dideoxygalactose transaminase